MASETETREGDLAREDFAVRAKAECGGREETPTMQQGVHSETRSRFRQGVDPGVVHKDSRWRQRGEGSDARRLEAV